MATTTPSKRLLSISADTIAGFDTMTYGGLNVATEQFVSTQVSNLISSAPGALDTLNELAAAIGDDANFATTVTNSIATKLDASVNPLKAASVSNDTITFTRADNTTFAITTSDANTDTNYFLDGITRSGNTLTFSVSGTTNRTYTFGSAAWSATSAFDGAGSADAVNTRIDSEIIPLIDGKADASHTHAYLPLAGGTITGSLTVAGSETRGTYTSLSQYHSGADNIVLKGNASGISSIFFESEKDGTNINHPSDFGFIQYHAYGTSTSGESNELIIGVSNDADDHVILNAPDVNGLKFRTGVSETDYTVYHSGNLSLATLGYTGATNANYITNNNQLTNGAGYVTSSGNTIIGTDSDINTSGSTIIDNIYVTDGVITSMGTRVLTLADLGYTGATNANYITNNNQLTNGAGYLTTSGKAADSNLLDGINSTGFVRYDGRLSANADTVTYTSVKVWDVSTASDAPGGAADGLLTTKYWDSSNWAVQSYHDFHTNRLHLRSKQSGTWQAEWSEVWTTDNFNPASYLTTSGKAADSNLLDGINSTSFLRSDANDTHSGQLALTSITAAAGTIANTKGSYLHIGAWGVARTAVDAVLVNTAYRSDILSYTRSFTIGNTARNFNGSANVSWSLADIGAESAGAAAAVNDRIDNDVLPAIPTNNNQLTNGAGYITGFDITTQTDGKYLRSNADDSFSGALTSTARNNGIFGTYDSTKTDHIWSMGTAYKNSSTGADFGGLYGIAYKHTNNPTGGTMAGGHQAVFVNNGTPGTAISFSGGVWTSNHGDSGNWKQAYDNYITGAAFSGTTTKTLTLTQRDGGTITASFTDAAGSGGDGYLSGLAFNTGTGVLTGTVTGGTDVTVDLDGRYEGAGAAATVNDRIDTEVLPAIGAVTLASLGFTGATNANYITNNTQISNGRGYLTSTNDRVYITDSRGAVRAPSYYNDRYAQWDFQNASDTTAGGDSWHALLTVSKWSSYDNSHRQEQLIFTGDNLKRRTATSDSAWGGVKTIWDTGNINPLTNATVSNDTITFTKGDGTTFAITTSDANTNTVTSVGISGDLSTGNITLVGTGATSITKSGGTITINSTDNNTTYTVGDGELSEKNFTAALKTKLDGIASGAEQNVQSDWNATSGDAFIVNKPTTFTPSSHTHSIANVTGLQTALDGKQASGSYLLTTGKAADSEKLDGIDSTSFLRSDADDTLSQTLVVNQTGLGGNEGSIAYLSQGGVYIPRPRGGSYRTTSSNQTGALEIIMPATAWGDSDMLSFWVDVYDYAGGGVGESVSMYIYGYQYGTTDWTNNGAMILSDRNDKDFRVRFGHNGTNPVVWIGEIDSTWNYLQINVRDFQVGYSADDWDRYDDGWYINVVTSFGTVTDTASDNYPVAKQLEVARTISLIGDVTGSTTFDGSGNVSISAVVGNDSHTHDGRYYTETEIDTKLANVANWDTAYNDHITGIAVTGTTTKTITLTQQDGGTIAANFTDLSGAGGDGNDFLVNATWDAGNELLVFDVANQAPVSVALPDVLRDTTYTVGDGGLTQKNFTTTLKTKLDGIAAGATNVTDNNQLTNGAGYITTQRAISSTPTDGATTTAISSDWAFDNVKTAVPANALFTDNNTTYTAGTGLTLTGTEFSVTANAYLENWNITDGTTNTVIDNGGTVELKAGNNVSISNVSGVFTISATDTDTQYSVGDAGLTEKNFTSALKTKLDGIAAGATNVTNNNQLTNGAGYITSVPTTLSGNRTIGGDLTVSGNQVITAGANADVKFSVWDGTTYGIGMTSGVTYGGLNDYAMTFCMNNDTDRGFWWGYSGQTKSAGAMSLTTAGILTVASSITAGGDITAFSDARVKENIETIDNALDKVTQLRGVEYTRIGAEERSIGVIAQEVQEVLPEVVREGQDGMLSVAYGNITGVLIEAIKEQQKQIEELKAQLDGLTK